MTGFFAQPKNKFPGYYEFSPSGRKPQKQSVEDQVNMVKQLHQAFGGTLKINGKIQ